MKDVWFAAWALFSFIGSMLWLWFAYELAVKIANPKFTGYLIHLPGGGQTGTNFLLALFLGVVFFIIFLVLIIEWREQCKREGIA